MIKFNKINNIVINYQIIVIEFDKINENMTLSKINDL